jgi:hypothetical protein
LVETLKVFITGRRSQQESIRTEHGGELLQVLGTVELGYSDQLFVHELADAQVGEFAAVTGILDPAERQVRSRPCRLVDEDHTGVDLAGNPLATLAERGKQEIQKRITKLVLTPNETPEGRRLEVKGDVALFIGDGVMENKSLEGIAQHYTPARVEIAGILLDPALPLAA